MTRLPPHRISLTLFFTWDVSLQLWEEKGLLQREILYYTRLAEHGIHIDFLTWGTEKDLDIAKTLHANIQVTPLYCHIPAPKNKILRALLSPLALWAARKTLQKTGILKTNQMWGGWIAVLAKFLFRKPLLVRTGFELYRFTELQNKNCFRKILIGVLSWITYKSANLVYLATEEDKNFVTRTFSIPATRIKIRPNWIDTGKFAPRLHDVPLNSDRILFVGRLNAQKNLSLLIESVAGTKYGLDCYGTGELLEKLKLIATEKHADVRFMGSIANDKLPEIYTSYPVFALLSHYEGNPKSLLEAMSCGCAVLGTNVEGINSVIISGKNGLLCEKNIDSVQNSLNKLMINPTLRQALGDAARQTITGTHSITPLVRMECADYENLLNMEQLKK